MGVPEKVQTIFHVEDGKAHIEIRTLQGIVSRVDLEGEAVGHVHVEIPNCPAEVIKATPIVKKKVLAPKPDPPVVKKKRSKKVAHEVKEDESGFNIPAETIKMPSDG
jgi:hypothetical protein